MTTKAATDRYEVLLAEAAKIRGVSLWLDAWRRLRKNWAAMVSLVFLIVPGLLLVSHAALAAAVAAIHLADLRNVNSSRRTFGPWSFG